MHENFPREADLTPEVSLSGFEGSKTSQHPTDVTQRILNSLHHNGLEERQRQVREAQIGTYEWILYPRRKEARRFTDWLSSPTETRHIFWIHGKPGSGKSTMMRFIKDNVVVPGHFWPWSSDKPILRAEYFFWNPGSEMQKSVIGLLRAILYQLVSQLRLNRPDLLPQVLDQAMWRSASTTSNSLLPWTRIDLQDTLLKLLVSAHKFGMTFLLIDGLDELDGTEETREELLQFLLQVAGLKHVKICLSSRPWNSFRDAFEDFPNLKLEDATQNDIEVFVKAQLSNQPRFRFMLSYQRDSAEDLMRDISERASGVFLWVHLVLRHLLVRIRDGDGISKLRQQLLLIPDDLNCYLKQMFDSIPADRRREASVLLQIALYEELDFHTLHPLRLLDLSFIEAGQPGFLLSKDYDLQHQGLTDSNDIAFRLDSTLRLLNSCCMGILECHNHSNLEKSQLIDDEDRGKPLAITMSENAQDNDWTTAKQTAASPGDPSNIMQCDLFRANTLTVDFFHRTCRDFLLTPIAQDLLHNSTHGSYDARFFLLNARICEFVALQSVEKCRPQAINLASNILSSFARPSYCNDAACARLAALFAPHFESLMDVLDEQGSSASYIYPSVDSWEDEESSFLTLAIDFGLHSYVREHLSTQCIRVKKGRPILDYILRPRFPGMRMHIDIGNSAPNAEFISAVLSRGADPNEVYLSSSVWALFLCFVADLFAFHPREKQGSVYTAALKLMIQAGAATSLPKSWLSAQTKYALYSYEPFLREGVRRSKNKRFSIRWPGAQPIQDHNQNAHSEPIFAIADLLERFRPQLGSDIDELKMALNHKDTAGIGVDGLGSSSPCATR